MTSLATMAQTSDSLKLRQRNERLVEQKKRRDSLETVFYSTHDYFEVSLELNHEKVSITDGTKFYVTDGQKDYPSNRIDEGKYKFSDLPDSVKFGLEFDGIKLETGFIKMVFYKNGARLRFGHLDNILELKEKWEDGKHEDIFNNWTQTEPYLDLINDRKLIKAARRKKITAIEFVVFSPTVYGDGVKITFRTIRQK